MTSELDKHSCLEWAYVNAYGGDTLLELWKRREVYESPLETHAVTQTGLYHVDIW